MSENFVNQYPIPSAVVFTSAASGAPGPAGPAGSVGATGPIASVAGDASGSLSGSTETLTVTQAQGGVLTFNAATGLIGVSTAVTGSGMYQFPTAGSQGADMTLTPQAATSGAGIPGNLIVNIPATGTDTYADHGYFKVKEAGNTTFSVGKSSYWGRSLFFGDPGAGNAIFYDNNIAGNAYMGAQNFFGILLDGTYYAMFANDAKIGFGTNLPGANYTFGPITPDPSAGNALYLASANPVPSATPTGGGALFTVTGSLYWIGTSGTVTKIASA